MKLTACFFIAFSLSCAGYMYSKKLEARVKKIEKILLFLSQIKTEIEFTADNIEAIMELLSTSSELSELKFISACAEKLHSGDDFFSAWVDALNDRQNTYAFKKDDINLLLSFGSALGKTDSSGQIRNCEMHEKMFKERLKNAVEEKNRLSKPIRITGILTGAAVLIIFM